MADWVVVVDDDGINLKLAGRILSSKGMRVTAFKSGQALLNYVEDNPMPDLILLDIKMPGMDGFETLEKLRQIERAKDVPVIFLTGDGTRGAEAKGLSLGAMDFIKKPFIPEVLVLRVCHIIELDHLQKQLATEVVKKTEEANTDAMTGLLNKKASEHEIEQAIAECDGLLCMIDLDSFKLVNDLHGHDKGDEVLIRFSKLLREGLREGDIAGRIGGDEFVLYCRNIREENVIIKKINYFNEEIVKVAKELLGEDTTIPLGVSAGVAKIPDQGRLFESVKKKADQALYQVKLEGKHGCKVYSGEVNKSDEESVGFTNLETLYGERNEAKGAYVVASEQFRILYRYLKRFGHNYPYDIRLVVIGLEAIEGELDAEASEKFIETAAEVLRSSDVIMSQSADKVLLLLPKVDDENWMIPLERVLDRWKEKGDPNITFSYDSEALR